MRAHSTLDRCRTGVVAATLFAGSMLYAVSGSASGTAHASSSPAAAASEPTLCASIANLDRLVVRRRDAFPENHTRFTFPALVVVHSAGSVQDAAKALCALPKMPSGALHCPADWGITYHLSFSARGHTFPPVGVDATGCQEVHGLGPACWVARSPMFWKVLGRAMGIAHPDSRVFAGSGPNS